MARYTFQPLVSEDNAEALSVGSAGMGGDLLLHDARWFTRIRWVVVLVLLGIGGFGLVWPESMAVRFGVILSHCRER